MIIYEFLSTNQLQVFNLSDWIKYCAVLQILTKLSKADYIINRLVGVLGMLEELRKLVGCVNISDLRYGQYLDEARDLFNNMELF